MTNSPIRPVPYQTARRLAGMGLSIIPLHPWDRIKLIEGHEKQLGKSPCIKSWMDFMGRRATDAELRDWFDGHTDRNLAIVCGAISGFVVVDADSDEAIAWVEANLPPTPMMTRTTKGIHYWFRHPGVHVGNRARIKGTKLDIKGDRGYVVAPGSIHPSGRLYEALGEGWGDAELVPFLDPSWIQDEVLAAPSSPLPSAPRAAAGAPGGDGEWALGAEQRAWKYLDTVPPRAAGEGRNQARFKLACRLARGFNLPDDLVMEMLRAWNAKCPGPVPEADLQASLHNAHHSGGEAYGSALAVPPREPRRPPRRGAGPDPQPPPPGAPQEGGQEPQAPPPADDVPPDPSEPYGAHVCPWESFAEPLAMHKGEPRRWAGNLAKILRQDPRWGARLALNSMSQEVCWDPGSAGAYAAVAENFPDRIQEDIENTYHMSFARDEVATKLRAQAVEKTFHPVRRYLDGLPAWDEIDRIDFIPAEILGTQDVMARIYMRRFCIGAVRRVMCPGTKLDTAVVLVGEQGKRKSSFWRVLAGQDFFSDTPVELESKDRFLQVNAAWIVEMAEIDGMNSNKTAEEVKAFLSSNKDTFRPPYGRTPITLLRTSVCVGTTNRAEFLHDVTGSRRFWPISIDLPAGEEVDLGMLADWRDQIWAEALWRMAQDEPHWLTREEEDSRAATSVRFEAEDPWEGIMDHALDELRKKRHIEAGKPTLDLSPRATMADGWTVGEILLEMSVPAAQHTKSLTSRITNLLRKHGWRRRRVMLGSAYRWRWTDPADLQPEQLLEAI